MLKKLIEKRNSLVKKLSAIKDKAVAETRAMTDEETAEFDNIEAEIRSLDATIERAKRDLGNMEPDASIEGVDGGDGDGEATYEEEARALACYIRGAVDGETRSDVNLTLTDNGAVIPKTIADKIIKKVVEISPIYSRATHYNVKGTLSLPYYDEETDAVTVEYANEFGSLESHSGKMKSIDLTGFLAGTLTKISRSLLNSSDFDLVSFVINDMAEKISVWLDKELINGTDDKIQGLRGVTIEVKAAKTNAVTSDELIDLQDSVIDEYQRDAIWVMNRKTRSAIRKLKDANGRYLLQDDITSPFGKVLLGKPVYTTDQMGVMAAGKPAIYYGDMSGLAVKFVEEPNIQILRELYAPQHAIGAIGWLDVDSKVQNAQKIAKLTMAEE